MDIIEKRKRRLVVKKQDFFKWFLSELNPKRVGCFNGKENSGLRVLQGRVENLSFPVWKFFLRENQTLSNEMNHKKM